VAQIMLVGINGSEGAQRAAEFALDRAKASGSRLVVAFVVEWSFYQFLTPEELEARPKQYKMEIERAETMVLDPLVNA
jgi:nucleotide-binding universal stress UspA family protein